MKTALTIVFGLIALAGCVTSTPESTQQWDNILPAGAFSSVSLPKVEQLRGARDRHAFSFAVDINGEISLCGTKLDLKYFCNVIKKSMSDSATREDSPIYVQFGADEGIPFEKLWPILLACRDQGFGRIGFAISTGDQKFMNFIFVSLPKADTELPNLNLPSSEAIVIHVAPGRISNGQKIFTGPTMKADYENYVHEFIVQSSVSDKPIVIVPSKDVKHGEVISAIYACWIQNERNIILIDEDMLNETDKK